MAHQQFCLRWSNHQSTLISVFDKLLENETLVDCTLSAEGGYQRAHRMVLCASSPYFETLLSKHNDKHPIVILTNVKSSELIYIMDYMYRGEVNIPLDHLKSFLKTANSLQIKGLSEICANNDSFNVLVTPVKHSTGISKHMVIESENPTCSSIDDRVSPSRKRRRRRNSQDSNFNVDYTLLDNSNSYRFLRQVQLAHSTPNISDVSSSPGRNIIIKQEETEMANQTSMGTSLLQPGSIAENTESPKPLIVPKTECSDLDTNSKDSVEDFTLGDDNDDMNKTDIQNLPMPHESFNTSASTTSNHVFTKWRYRNNWSATDEVSIASQNSESAHGDMFKCNLCGHTYRRIGDLKSRHKCRPKKRLIVCSLCPFATKKKESLGLHVFRNHM